MTMNAFLDLDPPARLAIAYARSDVRSAFALLLQIDNRFADILRNAREPMIAQIKMAWWREAFASAVEARPKGEPLLQALNETGECIPLSALEALASAWEHLLCHELFSQEVIDTHTELRAEAIFAVTHEMANTLDDILSRRTRSRIINRRATVANARDVAKLVAPLLGWSEQEINNEVLAFANSCSLEDEASVTV